MSERDVDVKQRAGEFRPSYLTTQDTPRRGLQQEFALGDLQIVNHP